MKASDLRLVLVHVEGEGSSLVSLALREVLATTQQEQMTPGSGVRWTVHVGEKQERQARIHAGLDPEQQGFPGWNVMFGWLEDRLAARQGRPADDQGEYEWEDEPYWMTWVPDEGVQEMGATLTYASVEQLYEGLGNFLTEAGQVVSKQLVRPQDVLPGLRWEVKLPTGRLLYGRE